MSPASKSLLIKTLGRELGLAQVGVARVGPLPGAAYYKNWLERGHHGTMAYLARGSEPRSDPAALLPGARSVICAALSYASGRESPAARADRTDGRVARYARGRDYHVVIRARLNRLVERLHGEIEEPFETRVFVDTGPLIEREITAAAGLGWIGKNTLLLNARLGSYTLLGEVLTTLELAADTPDIDHCGSCTRCLDACPTHAFPAPYQMDATRCISYLTIEHRGPIPPEHHQPMSNWLYGCDICQEVCPFNDPDITAGDPDLLADALPAELDAASVLNMTCDRYRELVSDSAAERARLPMWQRNAAIVLGNAAALSDVERAALRQAADSQDQSVREAARAALGRHGEPLGGSV